jgi:CHAT domain-containing protein
MMREEIPDKTQILLAYAQAGQAVAPLMFQSDALKNQGNLPAARQAYDQLISVLKQQLQIVLLNNQHYPDSPYDLPPILEPLLNAMQIQADLCDALADWERAEALREESLALADQYLPASAKAAQGQAVAAALVAQGRFNEALVTLALARDHAQQQGDPLRMADVTSDLAGILEWLGDFERALAEVGTARQYLEPWLSGADISQDDVARALLGGQLQEAELRARLLHVWLDLEQVEARIHRYRGDFVQAERQFRRVKPNIPAMAHPAIDYQLAAMLVADGQYVEGLALVEQLEPTFHGLLRPKLGVLLRVKAEALLGLGRLDEGLAAVDGALADLAQYRDPDSLWRVQWLRARTLQALDRPAAALDAYVETANTINGLRKAPLGYRLDSTYLQEKLPVFEAAISLACDLDQAETACRLMEMIKSRILTATLSIPPGDQALGAGELDRRVDQLSTQVDALEYRGYQQGWTTELEDRRAALLAERDALMEQIRYSDPRWRSLTEPVPFDLPVLLDLLDKRDQAALTLFYQPEQVVGVFLKDRKCSIEAMPLGSKTKAALEHYLGNLQAKAPKVAWFDPSLGLGLEAQHLLPARLLEPALQSSGLVIVPHSSLHLLPWAVLTFRGKRIFEHCPVSIAPNLSCLLALQADWSAEPRVALLGAPDYSTLANWETLHLAVDELLTLEGLYPSPPGIIDELRMEQAATENGFWRLAQHPDAPGNILHVSCHGTFVTGDPMNSGLLLTDAKVDATEIARRRLPYNEVILSACSTGRRPTEIQGVQLTGDDIVGLPGALLEAGARSVLVSIPPAREDATLEFMTIYHENRVNGMTPMLALRETQSSMLANPLYPPHLWGGFTVYGCR